MAPTDIGPAIAATYDARMGWERFAIWALVMLAASAAACRNFQSPASGAKDASSGGAGSGGAVGTGGAAPAGSGGTGGATVGSGGTGGATIADAGGPSSTGGAAVDSSSPTGTGGGATVLSADEACRAAVDVLCRRAEICLDTPCPKSTPYSIFPCPEYYFNDASERTPANITACLADMQRQPCSDVALLAKPACFAQGKRAGGEGCTHSSQCRSGGCKIAGALMCGTCTASAETGQPCGTDVGQCRPGNFCHRITKVCTPASSITHAAEGQPCDLSASPAAGCEGDLVCELASDAGTVGTCRRAPAAGQPCAQIGGGLNAVCAGAPDVVCSSGMCRFQRPCGDTGCDANSTCQTSDQTCVPRAGDGEACNDPTMGGRPLCKDRWTCDAVTHTCTRPRANGESCDDAHPCSTTFLQCTGGICQGIGAAACPP